MSNVDRNKNLACIRACWCKSQSLSKFSSLFKNVSKLQRRNMHFLTTKMFLIFVICIVSNLIFIYLTGIVSNLR